MTLTEYINKLRKDGRLEPYAASCGITASYLDRVLKPALYCPKPKVLEALYKESNGNVRKKDIVAHFAKIKAQIEARNMK